MIGGITDTTVITMGTAREGMTVRVGTTDIGAAAIDLPRGRAIESFAIGPLHLAAGGIFYSRPTSTASPVSTYQRYPRTATLHASARISM